MPSRLRTSPYPIKSFTMTLVLIGFLSLMILGNKYNNLANAKPNLINTWSECPPQSDTIWVELDSFHSPTGARNVVEIPFDTGTIWIDGYEYDNYVRGVLAGEVSTTTESGEAVIFDNEALKAMAVAIRTKVYHLCGNASYGYEFPDNNGITRHGIAGQVVQDYQYEKALVTYTQEDRERYQAAADDTDGQYLTHGGETFDIYYRTIGDDETQNLNPNGPHRGIFDYAGIYHATVEDDPGLPQINANHCATGDTHGTDLPRWNYRQILTHYYTGVHIRNTNGNILTPIRRWNPLFVADSFPLIVYPNSQYPMLLFIMKNAS